MHILSSLDEFLLEIAQSADICLKPWKHSVLQTNNSDSSKFTLDNFNELILKIESRDLKGVRYVEHDMDLEVYRSGVELNVILSWSSFPLKPILWQGEHSLWMNANTGQRTTTPTDGLKLESLARRLRSQLSLLVID
tara:strand:- start:8211 stop:8621 length:411 start_codon:yes stop_codon:yes gene_type:complete